MTPEPLKILLVEDNPADARLVQEMLRQVAIPFQLTHVASLEAANATLTAGNTHLTTPAAVVLLDLSLPDAQGLEAVSRVCSVHPYVPIVVMSELSDEAIALQTLQLGAQDYLIKEQTDAQLLVRAVRYAIERFSRHRRELQQAYQGRLMKVVAVKDITRDRLLGGVANATNHLLTTRDFAAAITLALSALGKACNVDRVYIFENHIHPDTAESLMSQRFEWVRETVEAQIDNPERQNLPYSLFSPHWYSKLAAGKPLSGMVRDFSESEREMLEAQDILSIMIVPIFIEGEFWGFIGFEDCHSERQWTETEQAIITAAAGSIGGAIARKRTEEVLRQSEARFRAIFEYSGIGIGLANLDGQIEDSNPALCKMLGYSREELRRTLFCDHTHPDDRAANLELFKELVDRKSDNYETEKRFLRKDGRLIWSRLTVSLVQNSIGKPQFALSIIEEITDRKQAEIDLRDSKEAAEAGNRTKSEFLATMSHELRTPLQAILGLSQLLVQEIFGSLNAKQQEYITCIHSSGEHLLELINDILDLSKVEAGKEELTRVPLGVGELSDYAVTIVRDRAYEKGLQLTSEVDPQADICIGDERRVKQMLLNLLTNAIKFTPAGRVSLRIQKVPQGIAFTVADTGIGIAPEQLKLLFQPFKQLDSRLNRQYEGTGLGLALTRKLARLHGGDVTVQSTLGEGSQFTLFLPYEQR